MNPLNIDISTETMLMFQTDLVSDELDFSFFCKSLLILFMYVESNSVCLFCFYALTDEINLVNFGTEIDEMLKINMAYFNVQIPCKRGYNKILYT
jgi:hypothetical protein